MAFTWVLTLGVGAHTAQVLALDSLPTMSVEGRAPMLTNLTVENTSRAGERPAEGDVVGVSGYDFDDFDGDDEVLNGPDATSYQWLLDGTPITGAADRQYTVLDTDAGKSLSVQVTPKTDPSVTDPFVGLPVVSSAFAVGESTQPTSIEIHNAAGLLTGRPVVSEVLTATPICPAVCDPALEFTWKVDGVDVGTANTYTPTKDDQKKVITVSTPTVR